MSLSPRHYRIFWLAKSWISTSDGGKGWKRPWQKGWQNAAFERPFFQAFFNRNKPKEMDHCAKHMPCFSGIGQQWLPSISGAWLQWNPIPLRFPAMAPQTLQPNRPAEVRSAFRIPIHHPSCFAAIPGTNPEIFELQQLTVWLHFKTMAKNWKTCLSVENPLKMVLKICRLFKWHTRTRGRFWIHSFGPYLCCFLFKRFHIHSKTALGVWRPYGKTVGGALSAPREFQRITPRNLLLQPPTDGCGTLDLLKLKSPDKSCRPSCSSHSSKYG